jgi:hypothetical protein
MVRGSRDVSTVMIGAGPASHGHVGVRILPPALDVSKDRPVACFVLRDVLASATPGESPRHLVRVVAAAVDQRQIGSVRATERIDRAPLRALTIDGIEDHQAG